MKVAVQFLGTIRKRLENCCLSAKFFDLFDLFEEKTEEDDIYIYIQALIRHKLSRDMKYFLDLVYHVSPRSQLHS